MKRGKMFFILFLGLMAVIFLLGVGVLPAQAATVYFSDDFESGLGNWDVSGLDWAVTNITSRGGPILSPIVQVEIIPITLTPR